MAKYLCGFHCGFSNAASKHYQEGNHTSVSHWMGMKANTESIAIYASPSSP